jgi:transketolase
MASGSELSLVVDAGMRLAAEGVCVRLVSFPSWELFEKQDDSYRAEVLPAGARKLAVEAGIRQGWERYADAVISIDHYGASAPASILFKEFGFTVENVIEQARKLL